MPASAAPSRTSSVRAGLGCLILISGLLGGCTGKSEVFTPLNDDTGPSGMTGAQVKLDTLNPTSAAVERERNPYTGPSPSVISLSRDNWQETNFDVPVSGVRHHPHYTDDKPRFARQTARARGEYPGRTSSLETWSDQSSRSQALEGLAAPIRAGWDIIRFPVWAFRKAPWSVMESPREAYQRGPLKWKHEPITGTPLPPQPKTEPEDLDKAVEEGDPPSDAAEKSQQP